MNYLEVKNGETLQEGYCEEDYQQVLANDPYYEDIADKRDKAIEAVILTTNQQLKAPF